jgi:hypothetical protein
MKLPRPSFVRSKTGCSPRAKAGAESFQSIFHPGVIFAKSRLSYSVSSNALKYMKEIPRRSLMIQFRSKPPCKKVLMKMVTKNMTPLMDKFR